MTQQDDSFAIGLEVWLQQRPALLREAKIALLANRASVDRDLRFSWDAIEAVCPGSIAALMTPQHGLWGDAQANMIETDHGWHDALQVPIYSLYSETRRPTQAMLEGIDALVIDLQDVGTRVYTFAWTMLQCMRACADQGVAMIVLDRPNPLGGEIVEGPLVQPDYRSFVGDACIPMRHALTLGELALWLKKEYKIDLSLEVISMRGWSRQDGFPSRSRHWLPPSPNLPTLLSTQLYPGQVLWEGTNISEGRGTTTPFELIGAPFIEPERLIDRMRQHHDDSVVLLPICFRPTFDKWAGQLCGGVSIHVLDPSRLRSFRLTVQLISAVRELWPQDFAWLPPPYEYETIKPPIDILFGSDRLRCSLDQGIPRATDLIAADPPDWDPSDCHLY